MPAASSTSALPVLPDTARLPCLATLPPAAATTKVAAEETLKILAPSPPVPTTSTTWSRLESSTRVASSRITETAPTISSMVSLFMRMPMRKAPICASVHWPVMIRRMTSCISSVVRSSWLTTRFRASLMSISALRRSA
ncbi:hypothetical protein D3C80_696840 [compost metagenome]